MADVYATYDEYVEDTGDDASDQARAVAMLRQQSAKLRALTGIKNGQRLTEDQALLCRELVTDSVRKALVPPTLEGFGGDLSGATTAMFSANGFQQSVTMQNPSGAAYFDRSTLGALKATLGRRQRAGYIYPGFGG